MLNRGHTEASGLFDHFEGGIKAVKPCETISTEQFEQKSDGAATVKDPCVARQRRQSGEAQE
jgi:hypothetical protein